MNLGISIRPATIDDLQQLIELNQKVMVGIEKYDDIVSDFALTEQGKLFFKEAILRKDGCFLIAEFDGDMVGYINGGAMEVVYRKAKYFEIANLGVIQEMKRQGLGKRLVNEITLWAKNHGFEKIYLNCYAKNTEALSFYRSQGYQDIDVCLERKI